MIGKKRRKLEEIIVGIDLGTSNSLVSCMQDGRIDVLVNERGSRLTPSVVSLAQENNAIVGEIAKNQAVLNCDVTVSNCKRFMGTGKVFRINGRDYSPVEISALILRKLKKSAEERLGFPLSRAVITVPAHFNEKQRQDTVKAAEIAAIDVVRLLNEPTAAAIAYGIYRNRDANLMVVDIGGGTTDITLMDFHEGLFTVVGTGGSTGLGGCDLDTILVEWMAERFQEEYGINLLEDQVAKQQLYIQGEQARIDLSQTDSVELLVPYIASGPEGPVHLRQKITRKDLESLSHSFLRHLVELVETALDESGLEASWVTDLVFVGGLTRMPAVRHAITKFLDDDVTIWTDLNPDEAPVIGAGLLAGKFAGQNREFFIFKDITAHDLGIEDDNGDFVSLVKKGTTYPISVSRFFTTIQDNQKEITIHLLQRAFDGVIISLGSFTMTNLPARPAGELPIEVTISIDESRLIRISALELESGEEHSIAEKVDQSWDDESFARRGTGLTVV